MEALVVDEALEEVAPGSVGELLMAGPQVTPGYWRDPDATARSFMTLAGRRGTFYRTGDRVRRPSGNEPMRFVGRLDHQVKVLGHRVELGEIEARLREEPGVSSAAVVPWPVTPTGAAGTIAFVTGTSVDAAVIVSNLKAKVPHYAVPRAIHVLADLPLNVNGKVDRQALVALLQDGPSGR
jgi:acyl-CoA synthetase (AMP-forming)/AMP-acid ligase II